jgi:hypothetical protein
MPEWARNEKSNIDTKISELSGQYTMTKRPAYKYKLLVIVRLLLLAVPEVYFLALSA